MCDDRSWALLLPLIGDPFVFQYNIMLSDLLENNAKVLRKEYPILRFVDEDPNVGWCSFNPKLVLPPIDFIECYPPPKPKRNSRSDSD